MGRLVTVWGVVALVFVICQSATAQPLTLGQVDTFQGPSFNNWQQGANSPPGALTVVGGGQGGASDFYLRIVGTGGVGAGSRITAFNTAQWAGNYPAAGVTAIEMDLFAPTTSNAENLSFRIAFRTGFSGYLSQPFTVPRDGAWRHAVYNLTANDMIAVGGPSSFETFIQSVDEVRVLHSTSTFSLNGDPINGIVGIDNIRATAAPVPEPTGLLSLASVVLVAVSWLLRLRRPHS